MNGGEVVDVFRFVIFVVELGFCNLSLRSFSFR